MVARLLRAGSSSKKTLLTFPSYLFPKLPSPEHFSTVCRQSHLQSPPPPPPVAKKVPFSATAHGVTWQDPYRWMSNTNDPDFTSYINQENSYADAFMRDTQELQKTLYSEMVSRMPSKITTALERWGPWLYYQRIPEGKEYPIFYRKSAVENEGRLKKIPSYFNGGFVREQVLLDFNEIAEKHGHVHVHTCRISPDHRFLAYTFDTKGDERCELRIKDLVNDTTIFPQPRVEGVISLAWAQDSSTLFCTLCDQTQRPFRYIL